MENANELQRFSFQARDAINDILKYNDDDSLLSGEFLGKALLILESLDDEMPDILGYLMRHGNSRVQELAAFAFIKIANEADYLKDKYLSELSQASQLLVKRISKPEDEDSLQYTCAFMGLTGIIPDDAIPILDKLLDKQVHAATGSLTPIHAATALCWTSDVPRAKAQRYLARVLQSDDLLSKYHAAQTLMLRREELVDGLFVQAASALLSTVPELNWMLRVGLLKVLRNIGPDAVAFAPMVRELFQDSSLPIGHRAHAAETLGAIAKSDKENAKLFNQTLMSSDWRLVNGAVKGLINSECLQKKDVLHLVTHLNSSDEDLRLSVLTAFRDIGPQGEAAVPALIGHILKEPNAKLCILLAEAIAACGLAAVDPLIEEIKRHDLRTFSVAARSLTILAEKAVRPIAEKLLNHPENEVRGAGLLILDAMGKAAAPAIPELVEILNETQDWELTNIVLAVFAAMGTASAPAVHAVARALIEWKDEDVVKLATATLIKMGPEILPELLVIENLVEGVGKERVQQVISACKRRHDDRYLELERLSDDNLLRYFVLVGQAFDGNKRLSWKTIGERIKLGLTKIETSGNKLGSSGPAVQSNVKKLAKLLNKRSLTTHDEYSGNLSVTGKKLYEKIKDYLVARYGSYPSLSD